MVNKVIHCYEVYPGKWKVILMAHILAQEKINLIHVRPQAYIDAFFKKMEFWNESGPYHLTAPIHYENPKKHRELLFLCQRKIQHL